MNISDIATTLKMELGLWDITLPLKDENGKTKPIESVIQSVIEKITLPMYSQYVPWIRTGDCPIRNLKAVDKRRGIYMLPAFLTITPVMYVINIEPTQRNVGAYGSIIPGYGYTGYGGVGAAAQAVINANATMLLAGQMRAEPTWEWLKHNKIALYGYPDTILTFDVACQHLPNLETIEESCYSSFMQLAILDMKIFLWNLLKRYRNLPSAHGMIPLEIDEYQNASEEKKTMLADWDDRFHLDLPIWKYM